MTAELPIVTTAAPNWFQSAVQIKGSVLPIILPRVLLFGTLGLGATVLHHLDLPIEVATLGKLTDNVACNLVLGLLLVFRTNTAYERFWEGRKAWGEIIVAIRNLAREISLSSADLTRKDALSLLIAFAIATKLHLRETPLTTELDALIAATDVETWKHTSNIPLAIAIKLGDTFRDQHTQHQLDINQRLALTQLLNDLVAGFTNCERILKTPMPIAYAIYLKSLLLIYCCFLPFGLVASLDWWTTLVVMIISSILLGVEEIGNEIENPFGMDANDLPLDEICDTIGENVTLTQTLSR